MLIFVGALLLCNMPFNNCYSNILAAEKTGKRGL